MHCGPHVILSSVSLMQNWMGEIRSWFEPGTVDVFPYCAQTVSMFWADNGPWKTSQLPLEQRIVVVTDSVCLFLWVLLTGSHLLLVVQEGIYTSLCQGSIPHSSWDEECACMAALPTPSTRSFDKWYHFLSATLYLHFR